MRLLVVLLAVQQIKEVSSVPRVVPLLSGWHYDDLMRDSEDPVASIIVVWSSEWCQEAFERFGLTAEGEGFPSRSEVFIGHYDITAAREQVWWEDEYFLEDRFNISYAPAVIYIPPGGDWQKYDRWDGSQDEEVWQVWVKEKLALQVLVKNENEKPLRLVYPKIEDDRIEPGESVQVSVQPGERIVVSDSPKNEFYSRPIQAPASKSCSENGFRQEISFDKKALSESIEKRRARYLQENAAVTAKDNHLNARDQDTTFTHAAMIRQPQTVPGFDTTPYGLIDLPEEIRNHIWAYYKAHEAHRTIEAYSAIATGINQHIVNTTLVSFDIDMKQRDYIAKKLIQPYVEQWAKRPLEFTSFYGIREYHRGHELRMHVDRVATHVFSVIINLDQQGIDSDWTLDVIHFDGSRGSVVMRPNTMLFYQSAKLIHGRPKPLNGTLYVNAFCHYRPLDWPYEYGAGDILYRKEKDGRRVPVVDYKVQ